MIELTLEELLNGFQSEIANETRFIGVVVDIKGEKEVIINKRDNFESKARYYKMMYDENLNHKKSNGIRIVDFAFGDTFKDIQKALGEHL